MELDPALTLESDGATQTIAVDGELDMTTAGMLAAAIDAMRDGRVVPVTLDMAALTFVDSGGLRALLVATGGGGVRLVNRPDKLVRLLDLTLTASCFDIPDDEDELLDEH